MIHLHGLHLDRRWRGTFTAKFIEEITHRTGNFKPFSVFVKMLASAFDSDNHAVSLDLLTGEDLEALRQASGVNTNTKSGKTPTGFQSKRYLILTYQGEFDKVHYPMALSYCEVDDVGDLKRTIVRLREEMEGIRRNQVDPTTLHELESLSRAHRGEKERLARELNEYSIENNRLVDMIESLKSDNHLLRVRLERLESEARQRATLHSRPNSASSPRRTMTRSSSTIVNSPGNSLRPPAPSTRSSGSRPPTAPSNSFRTSSPIRAHSPQRNSVSYKSPYAQSNLRSPMSSTRSVDRSPIRKESPPRPPKLPLEPVIPAEPPSLSEVDARLQALQNFLRHQKRGV
jgi:hypothetical protein